MRILSAALMVILMNFFVDRAQASKDPLCGVFKAVAYAPEAKDGDRLILNPHAVTSMPLRLSENRRLTEELQGALLEVEVRLTSECLRDCPAELVRILRRVPPFERYTPFLRSPQALVRKEPCDPRASDAL